MSTDQKDQQLGRTAVVEQHDEKNLGAGKSRAASVVLTKDGIQVHPQPTSDPMDPLNWSFAQKHSILAIVMALYFMFTYITTTTVPSYPQVMEQLHISLNQMNWTVAIPALGLALGPLIWSSLADIYGRRLIFIVGTVIALAATIGAAKAPTYGGYMAARFFQGLGVSPAATVGLAIINDMFFEHERGAKVGLWVLAIDQGLLVGPLVGGFITLVDQYWVNWLTAILFAVILLAEVFLLPETLYPRNQMLEKMPYADEAPAVADIEKTERRRSEATDESLPRTKMLPFVNGRPVPGMRHPKPWDSVVRFGLTFNFPVIPVAILTYCFGWYWWVLSIITLVPSAYVQYSPQIQGLLFLGLILGTLASEVFFSGKLSDWLVAKRAKANNGVRIAEMRLVLVYPAVVFSSVGLIVWGISIDQGYHWIVGQIAFFLFAAGLQTGNTVVTSYAVDAYPLQSMSVVTFYSVFLNLSAFIDPFFIVPWQEATGYTWCFAAQGIITFFLCGPMFALLQRYGPTWRAKARQPGWVNPEYDSL